MRKILIGGFLGIMGMLGVTVLAAAAVMAPVSGWVTPPGRFVCTILENGTALPLLFSVTLMTIGLVILGIEYFRKEDEGEQHPCGKSDFIR